MTGKGLDSLGVGASYQQARRYERAPIRERGTLVLNGVSYAVIVGRLGGGGAFVETPLELPKGELFLLRFRVACFEEPLVVKAEVRWSADESADQPAGLGVAFVDLDPRKRTLLVEFVAERGNVLCEVEGLLKEQTADLDRMKDLLAKVDLDSVGSLEELRARVKDGMAGFFERPGRS